MRFMSGKRQEDCNRNAPSGSPVISLSLKIVLQPQKQMNNPKNCESDGLWNFAPCAGRFHRAVTRR
jgi:hypothetical protein